MSNIYKEKLSTIRKNILDGKNELSEALQYCGITNVKPNTNYPHDGSTSANYETFARYAELIRRLKSANSMILQFTIPTTTQLTNYKRTIVLPISYPNIGSMNFLNYIAKEVIDADNDTYQVTMDLDEPTKEEIYEGLIKENTITDVYGNECVDGNFNITMEDIEKFLTEDEQIELLSALSDEGVTIADEAPTYNYTVNWGDGTEATFTNGATYEENKAAIWHTYESGGTYDVEINGNFRRLITNGDDQPAWVLNGEYVYDKDGSYKIINAYSYGMIKYLTSVISWGNTLLNNMSNAFKRCEKLSEIPMYDTTNSFEDVTDFSNVFRRCYSLTKIPFNSNTNKGLFSGCEKATTFSGAFYGCSELSEPIPVKLIDGCLNVTSVASMFAECSKLTGSIPTGMLEGMTKLTNASEIFSNCQLMDGEISADLFKDSPNITNIYRLFYNCKKITGKITRNFIGGLSKLTIMRQAFYNCSGISGIESDAFYNITADNIDAREAFLGCNGITDIPQGLLESLTGSNLDLMRMFTNCTSLTTIASSALSELNVLNAKGMFGGCTSLTSALPTEHLDWGDYSTIKKWYGVFANCNKMANVSTIPLELGGDGDRRFSEGKVGAIVLQDKTYVDPKNYVYSEANKPVGVVYADVYLDSTKMTPTLANSATNVVSGSSVTNAVHKVYACVLTDTTRIWASQLNAEDVTTITNTSDTNVAYKSTRYNGEAYNNAIGEFITNKGYTDDRYQAYNYCKTYNDGIDGVTCFLPDAADLWDMYGERELILKATTKIINGGGFTTSNCYPIRVGTWYWSSAEGSASGAWSVYTSSASVYAWYNKWLSNYVRPAFSLPEI